MEHDVRVLPIADRPTPRFRRGIPAVAAIPLAAVLAGRSAQRDDPAGLERHDEFRRGWVFLTASEALSANNHKSARPGIGAYVASASVEGNLTRVLLVRISPPLTSKSASRSSPNKRA